MFGIKEINIEIEWISHHIIRIVLPPRHHTLVWSPEFASVIDLNSIAICLVPRTELNVFCICWRNHWMNTISIIQKPVKINTLGLYADLYADHRLVSEMSWWKLYCLKSSTTPQGQWVNDLWLWSMNWSIPFNIWQFQLSMSLCLDYRTDWSHKSCKGGSSLPREIRTRYRWPNL